MPKFGYSTVRLRNPSLFGPGMYFIEPRTIIRHLQTPGMNTRIPQPLARLAEKIGLPPRLWIENIDAFGNTPLQRAVIDNDMPRFQALAEMGANLSVKTMGNQTLTELAQSLGKRLPREVDDLLFAANRSAILDSQSRGEIGASASAFGFNAPQPD